MKIKNIKVYTNGAWVVHELPFEEYLNKAKSYADESDEAVFNSAKGYADGVANNALNSAKSYADSQDVTTLNSAKSYANNMDAVTLNSAKEFTIQEIQEALDSLEIEGAVLKANPEFESNTLRIVKYLSQVQPYESGSGAPGDIYVWDRFEVPRDGQVYRHTIVEKETGNIFVLDAYVDLNDPQPDTRVKDTVIINTIESLNIEKYESYDPPAEYGEAYVEYRFFIKDQEYTNTLWFAETEPYDYIFPNKSGTVATTDDVAAGVTKAKTYADTKSSAALSSAKSYTDTEIAKINVSGGSFSGTMFDQHTANDYTYTSIVKMDPNSDAMPTDSGLKVEYSKNRNGGSLGNDTKNTTTYTSDGVVLRHYHDNYSYGGQDCYDMTLNASSLDFTKRVPYRINNLGGTCYAFDTKYEVSKFKLSAPLENSGVLSKDDLSTVKFALPTDAEMKDGKMPYFETVSPVKDYSNGYRDMQSYKLELPRSTGTLAIYPTTSYAKGDYDSPAVVTINSSTPVSIYFKIGPENTYTGAKGHNYSKFMGFHMPDIGIFVTYEELLHAYSCYKNYTKFLSIGGSSSVNNGDSGLMISTIKNDALYLIQVHNIDKIFDEDNNQRFEIAFHCMQVTSRQGHIGSYNIGRVYAVQETLTEKITNSFNPGSGY